MVAHDGPERVLDRNVVLDQSIPRLRESKIFVARPKIYLTAS
ncbi:MAG: hypothetical protein AB9879_01635 [Methanothrix sp.]